MFNENAKEYREHSRSWKLGQDTVSEKDSYVHLGVLCDKYMNIDENVENCKNKLKASLFSIRNAAYMKMV